MKKILTLVILIISCTKVIKNLKIKIKDINDELIMAIENDRVHDSIRLIDKGANINYFSNNKTVIEVAIFKDNLTIIKILIERGVELNKNNIAKIYDLALRNFNRDIINLKKCFNHSMYRWKNRYN